MVFLFNRGERRGTIRRHWLPGMLLVAASLSAQIPGGFPEENPLLAKPAPAAATVQLKASQPPAFSIPVIPLGFAAPSLYYMGLRESLVSLDFLDEEHLLFTFRVPGLMHRDHKAGETVAERQIRALVIDIAKGQVEAETVWTLHDYDRYLWMLPDGHFLLRDRNEVLEGDSALQMKPAMRFPDLVQWLDPDPQGRYLAAGIRDFVAKPVSEDQIGVEPMPKYRLQILRREDGKVLLESRVAAPRHLALGVESYMASRYQQGLEWQIVRFPYFSSSEVSGKVRSTCPPLLNALASKITMATECDTLGDHKLAAVSPQGRLLWESLAPDHSIWPLLATAANGGRVARESLVMSRALSARNPFTSEDLRSQQVEVFNAADGKQVLSVQAWPMLDGGGNVAISPSARRVAVLADGFIRIYELPEAPVLQAP